MMDSEPKLKKFSIENHVKIHGADVIGVVRGIIYHQFDETRYLVEFMDLNTTQLITGAYPEHILTLAVDKRKDD